MPVKPAPPLMRHDVMNRTATPAPEPSPQAQAHSRELVRRIHAAIDSAAGELSFHDYMRMALYEPGLGYYAAAGGDALGGADDFITAPGVSPLFARCLARQCAEVLAAIDGGDILEPGPGTGVLAAGILAELEALGRLPAQYRLLEVSAELREQQVATLRERVPHLLERCHWHAAWPEHFSGVIVANEVADSLPVEGFRISEGGVEQRCVGREEDELVDRWRTAPPAVAAAVAHIEADLGRQLPVGYQSEFAPSLPGWVAGLADCLERGALLLIDYGYVRAEYYLPERTMGTLVCTRAHRAHGDPYDWPGLTDLTAFVDFTAITEAATDAGLELEGFTPQNHFLFATGLDDVAAGAIASADERTRLFASHQIKTLTLPGEMGERFNVIGFSRGLDAPLAGFAGLDLSRRL